MISLSTVSNFLHDNSVILTFDSLTGEGYVSWGDGTTEILDLDLLSAVHSYPSEQLYNVKVFDCSSEILNETVNIVLYRYPEIVAITNAEEFTNCAMTVTLSGFSLYDTSLVHLYASGSNSGIWEEESFWSHLRPVWRFELNEQVVSSVNIKDYCVEEFDGNDKLVGYSFEFDVNYFDQMPGNPILFFTIELGS